MREYTITVLVENIRLPLESGADEAILSARRIFSSKHMAAEITGAQLHRRSTDARKKDCVTFLYSVALTLKTKLSEGDFAAAGMKVVRDEPLVFKTGGEISGSRPVVVGFGPSGIFCAMLLAEYGYRPLVLERGGDVRSRVAAVASFYSRGTLDENCNIQFGAGGAGTFSDGKLTTRIGDPRCSYVLRRFVEFGAPDEILYKAKPHIGTDNLRSIVERAAQRLCELGGEIRYNCNVEQIRDGYVVADGEKIPYGALVLATGHSARSIYGELLANGFNISAKPYSVGVRIEHRAGTIDRAMYGSFAGHPALGHADYNLATHEGGRGVYTFCMCPGGEVVAAASDRGGVAVNGMSRFKRDGDNSNAAVAVTVNPQDYGNSPENAINFRVEIERAAFNAAKAGREYDAPMQTVGDFLGGRRGSMPRTINPSYMGGGRVVPCDMRTIFPPFVTDALDVGLRVFGRKLKGYDEPDAPLTGVETRTSSPVRIIRGDNFTATSHDRIYPCGEGAGYAGGIMSSAVDGIAVAGAIISRFKPE